MSIFQPEHRKSSPWDDQVARILSDNNSECHSAGEFADPNEIEYFLSNDLDVLYNLELRKPCTSAREIIEDRKRDLSLLFSEECSSFTFCTTFLRSNNSTDTIQSVENPGTTKEDDRTTSIPSSYHNVESTIIAKRAKIEPSLECNSKCLLDGDDSFLHDASISSEDPDKALFAQNSSFESIQKLHCFVKEYQSGLDVLKHCMKRTRDSRSKVTMIKGLYSSIKHSSEICCESKIFLESLNNTASHYREFKM